MSHPFVLLVLISILNFFTIPLGLVFTTFISGDFNCQHSSWDSHRLEDQLGQDLFGWVLSSELLALANPDHITLLHYSIGNRSPPGLSPVPASIASICIRQVLPDLGSNLLSVSITIPGYPMGNLASGPLSFNYNKARWDKYLFYKNTHCPPPSIFTTLSLSETIHTFTKLVNNATTSAVLSATSTTLLKLGDVLKSQDRCKKLENDENRCKNLFAFSKVST